MRIDDRSWAAILIAIGAGVIFVASGFPSHAGMSVGAGLFPIVLGSALVGASALLALTRQPAAGSGLIVMDSDFRQPRALLRVGAIFGSCLLFALLGKTLGFVIVAFIALFSLLWSFGSRPGPALMLAGVVVLVVDLFLVRVMRIPLPLGILTPVGGWL